MTRTLIVTVAAVAIVGSAATVTNLVRSARHARVAEAASASALDLSSKTSSARSVWLPKVEELRGTVRALRLRAPDRESGTTGLQIRAAALRMGIRITRVEVDSARSRTSFSVDGPPAAAFGWLKEVEETLSRTGGQLHLLTVAAGLSGQIEIEVEVYELGNDRREFGQDDLSAVDVQEAVQTWPAASIQAYTERFSRLPTPTNEVGSHPASRQQPDPDRHIAPVDQIELIGKTSIDGVRHYAMRFAGLGSTRTLAVGQEAYGWRLVSDGAAGLGLEKEGEHYAMPQ